MLLSWRFHPHYRIHQLSSRRSSINIGSVATSYTRPATPPPYSPALLPFSAGQSRLNTFARAVDLDVLDWPSWSPHMRSP